MSATSRPARSAVAVLAVLALAACATSETKSRDLAAAPWRPEASPTTASLRGLCVVDPDTAWASGSGGTVIRTTDGGETWNLLPVPGAEELDFRDVHAFDADSAVLMVAGQPARLYRTDDGGETFKIVHEESSDQAFFDSIDFCSRLGFAFSDPVDGKFLVLQSEDTGQTWSRVEGLPAPFEGEAGFAASGTMLATSHSEVWIATGGAKSHVLRSADFGKTWSTSDLPIRSGAPSQGAFSIATQRTWVEFDVPLSHGVAVGGDYRAEDDPTACAAFTTDSGRTWLSAEVGPSGFRSGVAFVAHDLDCFAVGPNGIDFSADGGRTWRRVHEPGYHAVAFAPSGAPVGWAVGADGRIAHYDAR